jgi:hypothetical protein
VYQINNQRLRAKRQYSSSRVRSLLAFSYDAPSNEPLIMMNPILRMRHFAHSLVSAGL